MFGAPPLGCLPFVRALFGGLRRLCSEEINMASKLFNSKLSSELHNLNQSLPQAKVVYIRIYDSLLNIIQNPTKYGTNLFLGPFPFFHKKKPCVKYLHTFVPILNPLIEFQDLKLLTKDAAAQGL